MTYTKIMFSQEIEALTSGGVLDHKKIATWAYTTKLDNVRDIDPCVDRWLDIIGVMDMGEEFELSLNDLRDLVEATKG